MKYQLTYDDTQWSVWEVTDDLLKEREIASSDIFMYVHWEQYSDPNGSKQNWKWITKEEAFLKCL